MLTRESFLAAFATGRVEAVSTPGVEGAFLRVLTLAELEPVIKRQSALPEGSLKAAAILVAATLCDANRQALFDVGSDLDLDKIASLPYSVVRTLSDQAARVNGLGADAAKDAEKN